MSWEFFDDAGDFFEDLVEILRERRPVTVRGEDHIISRTRGAYRFTEKLDSILRMVTGVSVLGSAVVSSVWGFASLKDIVTTLVSSIPGRIILIIIGGSYFLNGLWKYVHAGDTKKP